MPSASWPVTATRSSCSRPLLCARLRGHRRERLLGHPGGQVDVVGGEVLDHADVGDPGRERALAAGDDLVDLAELAGLQPGPQALQRRVVPLDVSDGADQAGLLEGLGELASPRPRTRPAASRSSRGRRPSASASAISSWYCGRYRDHAVVDAGGDQLLDVRVAPADRRPHRSWSPPGSATATSSTPSSDREHAGVVPAHHAQADQSGAQVRHLGTRLRDGVDRGDDPVQVVLGQRRVHGQREHLGARPSRSPAGRASRWNEGSRWFGIG